MRTDIVTLVSFDFLRPISKFVCHLHVTRTPTFASIFGFLNFSEKSFIRLTQSNVN